MVTVEPSCAVSCTVTDDFTQRKVVVKLCFGILPVATGRTVYLQDLRQRDKSGGKCVKCGENNEGQVTQCQWCW